MKDNMKNNEKLVVNFKRSFVSSFIREGKLEDRLDLSKIGTEDYCCKKLKFEDLQSISLFVHL